MQYACDSPPTETFRCRSSVPRNTCRRPRRRVVRSYVRSFAENYKTAIPVPIRKKTTIPVPVKKTAIVFTRKLRLPGSEVCVRRLDFFFVANLKKQFFFFFNFKILKFFCNEIHRRTSVNNRHVSCVPVSSQNRYS